MLTYVTLCITAYLAVEIMLAPSRADATPYVLVGSLLPLPVYLMGHSANAGLLPADVCLISYLLGHGLPSLSALLERNILSTGIGWLAAFALLAAGSGAFHYVFVDSGPVKFYAFTTMKLFEYALLAIAIVAAPPDARQLRRTCHIVIAGILIYEVLHLLHICNIVPLSGEKYFGSVPEDAQGYVADFTDRTAWFLTSPRIVVGGIASVSAWFSAMVFETYQGRVRFFATLATVLSVFSVLATNSRSDIAGLVVGFIVFALYGSRSRWKVYACAAIAIVSLYGAFLAFVASPSSRADAASRLSELWNPELRADGNYADRSEDRSSLLRYLRENPQDLIMGAGPGNYHWYQDHRITRLYMGHNSYLHWTGELGIGGLAVLLGWCATTYLYASRHTRSRSPLCQVAARSCLALIAGRVIAAWGGESLFGTEAMGNYSQFFVGVVYLLVALPSTVPLSHDSVGEAIVPWRASVNTIRTVVADRAAPEAVW